MRIILLSNNYQNRAEYLESIPLPTSYMEDFSKLGFLVSDLKSAYNLLISYNYPVKKVVSWAEVELQDHREIESIQHLLTSNNVTADFSDIADTIYQA